MKKLLALALTLVMAVTVFTACGSKDDDKVLKVGCEVGYPPFEMEAKDGSYEGFDIEIMKEVGKRMGKEIKTVNTSFKTIFNGLGKDYDCICSAITITPERQKTMLFSNGYIDNYQSIVLKTGSKLKINGFEDLDGLTVAFQDNTTSSKKMNDLNKTKTIKTKNIANEKVLTCFKQLKSGEVDAVVVDSTVIEGEYADDKDMQEVWQWKDNPEQLGIAIEKGNTDLQKKINKALAEMQKDGTIAKLQKKWFKQK